MGTSTLYFFVVNPIVLEGKKILNRMNTRWGWFVDFIRKGQN